jgi:hypothetical protein
MGEAVKGRRKYGRGRRNPRVIMTTWFTDAMAGQVLPHRAGREAVRMGHRREAEEDGLQQARDGGRPDVVSRGQVVRVSRLRRRLM